MMNTGHVSPSSAKPFLVLNENRFAYEAANRLNNKCVSMRTSLVYIYGPSGIGKSHLVRQFTRDAWRKQSNIRMVHVTASEFAAQFAVACERSSISEFQQIYRDLDIFVCEDLHALERHYEAQRQLITFLNENRLTGSRVLFTSRKAPGEMCNVLPRLVNRCHGGVCAEVTPPDSPSRARLIGHFAQLQQVPIPADVVQLLAQELPVSPRELLAMVIRMETIARLDTPSIIDIHFARRYLGREIKPRRPTIPQIARAVTHYFDLRLRDIRSNTRLHALLLPRQCAMYLARELTDEPLQTIASYFGRRNHSTVVHACRRIRRILSETPRLRRQLTQIRQSVTASEPNARS